MLATSMRDDKPSAFPLSSPCKQLEIKLNSNIFMAVPNILVSDRRWSRRLLIFTFLRNNLSGDIARRVTALVMPLNT